MFFSRQTTFTKKFEECFQDYSPCLVISPGSFRQCRPDCHGDGNKLQLLKRKHQNTKKKFKFDIFIKLFIYLFIL